MEHNAIDPMINDAILVIAEHDRVNASLLELLLRISYVRAARMIDDLEARGYIDAFDGTYGRTVLKRHPIDLPPPNPAFIAAVEDITVARSILGLSTPDYFDLPDAAAFEALAYFECSACGRLEMVGDASDALTAAVASDIGADWWREFTLLASRGELRPAVLQREHGLSFEQASDMLDSALALGLVRRSGLVWSLTEPRCVSCLEATLANRDRRPEGTSARDLVPAQMRFRVFQRDGFRCAYCGRSAKDGAVLHADHVIPVVAGGATTEDNLITACSSCNLGKATSPVV